MRVSIGTQYGQWSTAHTGKGRFINRLIPELDALGAMIVAPGGKADVDLQIGKYVWRPDAKKSILRMGCPHFDDPGPNRRKAEAIKKADAVIYQSKYAQHYCDKLLKKAKKSIVINNGAPIRLAQQDGNDMIFLASTRVWNKKKRLSDIVSGFAKAGIGKLWIAGKVAKKIKAPNVEYLGLLDDTELEWCYRKALAIIHLCERDCCPNSVVEAMSYGCRVITNSDAGTKELLTEHDIVLDSIGDLTAAIRKIKPDRLCPEKIDIKSVARRYLAFFEEVLDG